MRTKPNGQMQADEETLQEGPLDSARMAGMLLIIIILVIVVLAIHGKMGTASVLLILTTNLIIIKNELIKGHERQLRSDFHGGNHSGSNNTPDANLITRNINEMTTATPATSTVGEYLGPHYEDWANHQAAMPLRRPLGRRTCDDYPMGIDAGTVDMAYRRARDRDAIHGAHRKTADYYKYYFGDELAVAENKIWWGQPDV